MTSVSFVRHLAVTMVILSITTCVPVFGEDWPCWRGANHDDMCTETDLLESWPAGGPDQLWVNKDTGLGYAGISIAGDHLYTMGLFDDTEVALCLNAENGDELWRVDIGEIFENGWGDGPRSTPTIDDNRVYFMAAQGNLVCCDRENGEIVWKVAMQDFGGGIPQWGYAESPLVDGDKVICTPGGSEGMVLALDKMTGDKIWQSEPFETRNRRGQTTAAPAHYSSVVPAVLDGKKQYVQLTVACLTGISEEGETLWQVEWPGRIAVIPSPVISENRVYATSGYGIGSMAVEVDGDDAETMWRNQVMKNHHGGVIHKDGNLYGHSDQTGFICQSLETGELVWNERNIKKGAVLWADDRFYHIEEQGGRVLLINATEDGAEITGEFVLSPQTELRKPQGRIWMHPVIADGKLYLRDQEILHCYDIRE